MDLVGMVAADNQKKVMFTVLRSKTPWTADQVKFLVHEIFTEIFQHPKHPGVIIMKGEYSRERIAQLLGSDFGEHEILMGYGNPKLPFKPPLF